MLLIFTYVSFVKSFMLYDPCDSNKSLTSSSKLTENKLLSIFISFLFVERKIIFFIIPHT